MAVFDMVAAVVAPLVASVACYAAGYIQAHRSIARKNRRAVSMQLSLASTQPTEGNNMSDLTINLNSSKTTDTVDVTFKDGAGNVTTHHGALTATASDATLFTAIVADDNSHVVVTALGPAGTATLQVTDAADNIVATATVIVDAGEAVSMALSDADSEAAAAGAAQTGDAPAAA